MNKLLLLAALVITLAVAAEGFREFESEEELALARDARSPDELALDRQERSPKKKGGKGKRGQGKNARRNRKDKKDKKGKGGKKGGKGRRTHKNKNKKNLNRSGKSKSNGNRRKTGLRQTTCTVSETCLANAMSYLKMMKDNVGNYLKQDTRMKRANTTVDNKSGKKGIFGPTLRRIVKAGGGNKSNLQCSGSSTSKGALQLKNLTDTLLKCEKTINASCDKESFPHPNMTAVKECKTAMTSFTTLVDGCQKKSGSEACTCWTDTAFTPLVATIKGCSISEDSKAIVKQMGYCKGNFSLCKKFEDEGLVAISACSESTADLLTKAKSLTASKTGLTNAKTAATTMSGSSGRRVARAAATTCAEVIAKITALLKAVGENPASAQVATLAGEVAGLSLTCTDTEKASLTGQVTSISTAIESVDAELATVQSDLLTATGTTASTSSISGAADSTASSSGRRNIVARHLMNHFNLH